MRSTFRIPAIVAVLTLAVLLAPPPRAAEDPPKMKFNEVKEIAPGVFFRYSQISATDPKVVFGGSNNIWVVFEDYVLVYDANFPKEAGDVIAAVRKTTKKPIRYVLDSHHHGDHAYGNAVFAAEGASIIAQRNCANLLRTTGPADFKQAGMGPNGRKDVALSKLKQVDVIFDDKLVFDDGTQRAECLHFGHSHTAGDAVLYLPKHKILCTGDACGNGAFNYTGHSDTASWIRCLEKMQQLDIKFICPGHGEMATKELLDKQKRYLAELRKQVQKGIDANKSFDDIQASIDMPFYKEWTGVEAKERKENIEHVFGELTGRVAPADLLTDFSLYEGPSPTKDTPGWTKPKRIVIPNLMPARLAELKIIAPEVEFVPAKTPEDAAKAAVDADAVIGYCTPEIVKAGKNLRWIQHGAAGIEKDLFKDLQDSKIVLTNAQQIYSPATADTAMALLLSLARNLPRGSTNWEALRKEAKPQELNGKTLLVVGLGGIGEAIARRANAFGMRVMGIRMKDTERPSFVFSVDKPDKLMDRLKEADAVVLASPLTNETRGMIGTEQLKAMKKTAYLINIARGGLIKTPDLIEALDKGVIAGAGLDVTDPEPLPADHPLWKKPNVVISPHIGGQSPESMERQWRLYRENVRRFVAGEPLLCVVDKARGY